MINALFAARADRWEKYAPALRDAFARSGLDVDLRQAFDPAEVDYIIYAPNSDVQDFRPFTRAKAVLNLWAGVENVVGNDTLRIPLCRMVETGLTEGMTEWVVGHVLRHHLDIDYFLDRQDGVWDAKEPPLARNRRVAVLGLGELGQASARALASLNFQVSGWSRSPKRVEGVRTFSGDDGLAKVLSEAEFLVLLLPLTPRTEGLMDAGHLALLPRGAVILNPGRGGLIDDEALIAALDSGQVGHATLDVFRVEPLPADHPYWGHPRVTVTPHIASATRPETSAETIAENIRRGEAGEPLLHVVDRARGY